MSIVYTRFPSFALVFLLWLFISSLRLLAQPFVDPCFTSGTVGPSFASTANIRNQDADLLNWTGAAWTGGWGGANITLAPPGGVPGTRAIWSGDGTVWTTGGEGFGLRLTTPIVNGTTYTFSFRRVSHGTGQNGNFAPVLYTNTGGTFGTSYGAIPGVGTAWNNSNITFTAGAASAGHTHIYFHNSVGSGMFMGCTMPILPMAFSGLEAFQVGDVVQLGWQVQDEENYAWHVVERSADGEAYAEVGRLPSVQAGAAGHLYDFADPIGGGVYHDRLYYRIRSLDLEGKEALSPVVMTRIASATAFEMRIFPNPTAQNASVEVAFYAAQAGPAQFALYDLEGRMLRGGEWLLQAGRNQQDLQLDGVAAGMYLLEVRTAGGNSKVRLQVY